MYKEPPLVGSVAVTVVKNSVKVVVAKRFVARSEVLAVAAAAAVPCRTHE